MILKERESSRHGRLSDLLLAALFSARHGAGFVIRDFTLAVATAILALLSLLAVFGPFVWRTDPATIHLASTLRPPSLAHPMGTDGIGRDVFARFNEGARISMVVGVVVVLVGAAAGSALGVAAGAVGGWVDLLTVRVLDAVLAFPSLILAMAVTVGLGAGLTTAAIGIAITSVPYYARIVRAETIRLRSALFVQAATAIGSSRRRTILRHIVPNVVVTLPLLAAANFGYVILTLAALGYVGLGAQIPTPEWGAMITDGQNYLLTGQWWIAVSPGLGLLLAVTAANMVADRIRDVFDPRESLGGLGSHDAIPASVEEELVMGHVEGRSA